MTKDRKVEILKKMQLKYPDMKSYIEQIITRITDGCKQSQGKTNS